MMFAFILFCFSLPCGYLALVCLRFAYGLLTACVLRKGRPCAFRAFPPLATTVARGAALAALRPPKLARALALRSSLREALRPCALAKSEALKGNGKINSGEYKNLPASARESLLSFKAEGSLNIDGKRDVLHNLSLPVFFQKFLPANLGNVESVLKLAIFVLFRVFYRKIFSGYTNIIKNFPRKSIKKTLKIQKIEYCPRSLDLHRVKSAPRLQIVKTILCKFLCYGRDIFFSFKANPIGKAELKNAGFLVKLILRKIFVYGGGMLLLSGLNYSAFAEVSYYDKKTYGEYKLGKPYQISGKTYTPRVYDKLEEEGYISWYGAEFHAKSTSNGAIFNKNTYTAAHRTLPMPSVVEVENLMNGKKVVLIVNDRGPFSPSQHRILDVSERVARDLGFLSDGVTKARIRLLAKETEAFKNGGGVKLGVSSGGRVIADSFVKPSNVHVHTASESIKSSHEFGYLPGYYVQVGAFKSRDNAMKVFNTLKEGGVKDVKIRTQKDLDGETIEIVRVGVYATELLVREAHKSVQGLGYRESRIVFVQ